MCPYQLKLDQNQDFRKTRCLLNEKLCKYSFSWRLFNSQVRHTIKRLSHFTGYISYTLWKFRSHHLSSIMFSPTKNEAWQIGITSIFPLVHIWDKVKYMFSCFWNNSLKDQALLARERKGSKHIFTATCLDFCKPKLGATSWLWSEFMTHKWPNLFFLNKMISKVSLTAWKWENLACPLLLLSNILNLEYTLHQTLCSAFYASIFM